MQVIFGRFLLVVCYVCKIIEKQAVWATREAPVIKFSRNELERRSGTSSWRSTTLIKRSYRERGKSWTRASSSCNYLYNLQQLLYFPNCNLSSCNLVNIVIVVNCTNNCNLNRICNLEITVLLYIVLRLCWAWWLVCS